jgi:hypothetical protein
VAFGLTLAGVDCRGGEFKSSPAPFQGFFFLSNTSYSLNRQQAYHERDKSSRKNTENSLLSFRWISHSEYTLSNGCLLSLFNPSPIARRGLGGVVASMQAHAASPRPWMFSRHARRVTWPPDTKVLHTYSCVKLQSGHWWLGGSANVCTAVLRSSCTGGRTRG